MRLICLLFGMAMGSLMEEYLDSSFGKTIPEDMNSLIQDFYHDLSTGISDFGQLSEIVLPFNRLGATRDRSAPIFEYKPNVPVYHLKQNHELVVSKIDKRNSRFTFQRHSGNCSQVRLGAKRRRFRKPPRIPRESLWLEKDGDEIQLRISFLSKSGPFFLFVPDKCLLYMTRIERTIYYTDKGTQRMVKYSHRNNRPAEIVGLVSSEIQNLETEINYLPYLSDFPRLTLHRYSESLAEFRYNAPDTGKPYVVPQNWKLSFHEIAPEVQVRMLFRKPLHCEMHPLNQLPQIASRPMDQDKVEFQFDRVTSRGNWKWTTSPNCEFQLLQIIKKMPLTPGTTNSKILKYGINQDEMNLVRIRVTSELIQVPWYKQVIYIETFRDFGRIRYQYSTSGFPVYQKWFQHNVMIPQNIELDLPIHQNSPIEYIDVVSIVLNLQTLEKNCQVKIYHQQDQEPVEMEDRGLVKQARFSADVKVKIQLESIREKYGRWTRVFLKSSCRLRVYRIKVI